MSFMISVLLLVALCAFSSNTVSEVQVQELTQGISKFSADIYEVTTYNMYNSQIEEY